MSTFSAGVPAGTSKKKLFDWFRSMVPVLATVKLLPRVNWSAATTVFIVWASTPGLLGSLRLRMAECTPEVVGLTATSNVTGEFSGSAMEPGEPKVSSLPTQLTAYDLVPPPPEVRVNV